MKLCIRSSGFCCVILAGFLSILGGPAQADGPLQGRVEEEGAVSPKSIKDDLQAKMDQLELQGGAQQNGLSGGVQGQGTNPLQGSASNPGAFNLNATGNQAMGDQELQIAWDRWRNTLTQTIQAGTLNKINIHNDVNFVWDQKRQMMVSRYPQGISAWYTCDVLPDRRIINVGLTQPSGFPSYDQAVMQSIMELQGNPILTYPPGSNRQIVTQQGSVRTAQETHFQNFQFGDIEHQRH